jgi:hypothetical protein
MAISPADFYAYSRATGAPVPEDPEERALMAPEVLEFRRNQLKAPSNEGNALQTLGAVALAGAAALGAGLAGRRFLRGRQEIPKAPTRAANAGVVQQDLNTVRRIVEITAPTVKASKVVSPSAPALTTTENAVPVDPTDRLLEELQEMRVARGKEVTGRMEAAYGKRLERSADELLSELQKPSITLTDVQDATEPLQRSQFVNAVESGEDQQTGRMKAQLQRNEQYDLSQVELLEEIAEQNRIAGMEQDEPINMAAAQMPDGIPFDQAEGTSSLSSQELADLATEEMVALRQNLAPQFLNSFANKLISKGITPETNPDKYNRMVSRYSNALQQGQVQRFENALAQSWTTKSIPGVSPGTPEFKRLQELNKIDISLPSAVRKAVEAESAGAGPMGFIPERTVINIGPEAKITSTAAGTAIRGASPSAYEALPINRTRQIFGTADPLVTGALDEDMPDLPGALRLRGGPQPQAEPEQLSKQEIVYSVLDRPVQEERPGGSAGIGVYGIEPGYVPGAVSKFTGEYSLASSRQPTYVPSWLQKKQMPINTGFEQLSTPTIQKLIEGEGKTPLSKTRMQLAQNIVAQRGRTKESLALSEVLRRATIEGRDPQMVLRNFGFDV